MIDMEKYRDSLQDTCKSWEIFRVWRQFIEKYNADQKAAYMEYMDACRALYVQYMALVDNQNRALTLRLETAEQLAPGDGYDQARELPLYCIPVNRTALFRSDLGSRLPELQFFARLGYITDDESASVSMILKAKEPDTEF